MVRIVRILLVLIVVVVLTFPNESHSGVRLADVGFEVGGAVGVVSPTEFNEYFDISDADAMTWVYGFGAATVLPLGEIFRVSIGSGYTRSQSRKGLFLDPSATMVPIPADYVVESVPLTGRVDYLATESIPIVTVGVALEMHFLTVTQRIHAQPALGFVEQSASATIPGLSGTIGIEWPLNQKIFLGLRGGYRFTEGDVPFFDRYRIPEDEKYRFDLAGPFATMLIRVHPWQRASKD
jgi:hypothetical protein